ncbi:MAG TPA: S24/S26 family peptidase [Lacunisphaera sp.]|nr:S24/S26 family peptidase [Lacunisphaera sp.]
MNLPAANHSRPSAAHRLPAAILAILGFLGLGSAAVRGASYREALAQVDHEQVSLNPRVQSAMAELTRRCPGAAFAACAPTGSMKPTLDENYLVALEECPFGRLVRGDIILVSFNAGAHYVAVMHRIADVAGLGSFRTQGDALPQFDPVSTTRANYLGRRVIAAVHRQSGTIRWLGKGEVVSFSAPPVKARSRADTRAWPVPALPRLPEIFRPPL